MQIIRLKINDKVYKNLMWFLSKFSKNEIQVINDKEEFISIQDYLATNANTQIWNTLSEIQQQEVLLSFEESENEINLVENSEVMKKYNKWL